LLQDNSKIDMRIALQNSGCAVQGAVELELSAADFKRAMRRFPASVCIIATGRVPRRAGLTATAVCGLTAAPPQMLACLSAETGTCKAIQSNRVFSINVLRGRDAKLAQRFAGLSPEGLVGEQRFNGGDWHEGGLKVPILRSALFVLECRLNALHVESTHNIIIGKVVTIVAAGDEPALMYRDGQFGTWIPVMTAAG
jgi:flavin reductase (DIM6/NTAB) family NADH-FMN oxidoreductase RutF